MMFLSGKSVAQCGFTFYNSIDCGATIDITWSFLDCNGYIPGSPLAPGTNGQPCGSGGSASAFTGTIVIPCDIMCTNVGGTCGIIITVTAINGCSIVPTSLSWMDAENGGGVARALLPCPSVSCLPANCCDLGTALIIDINNGSFAVN